MAYVALPLPEHHAPNQTQKLADHHMTALEEVMRELRGNQALETSARVGQFGDPGAVALAGALETNTTLVLLNLGSNAIGDAGGDGAGQGADDQRGAVRSFSESE